MTFTAIGLALADISTEIQAVRVTDRNYSGGQRLQQLINKTLDMMRRIDKSVPRDLAARTNIRLRHSFFGDGYAHSNDATDFAVRFALENMGLTLESTYTGKTMAALLADLESSHDDQAKILFWNTYNSVTLPAIVEAVPGRGELPVEFLSYFS